MLNSKVKLSVKLADLPLCHRTVDLLYKSIPGMCSKRIKYKVISADLSCSLLSEKAHILDFVYY